MICRNLSFLLILSLVGAGCAPVRPEVSASPPPPVAVTLPPTKGDVWQGIANPQDGDRIRRLSSAWSEGLREAKAGRFASAIRAEGELLDPKAALARPAPTPGSYSCRLIRLGRPTRRDPPLEKFKPFFCYVEVDGDLLTVVKQTGSERPAGRLWEDDVESRLIFLGSVALGSEEQPKAYGEDPSRDMAGVLERVAPMRWRLVIPWPRSLAKIEVFELTPVPEQPRAS